MVKAALIWEQVEKAGVPDVRGVWCHEAGGGRLFNIISIKQRYPGHARQAMLCASQVHAGAYLGRYVIVVDEDIDPTNTFDVIWALASRSDPVESIEILRRCWSGPLDPRIQPGKRVSTPAPLSTPAGLRVDERFPTGRGVFARAEGEDPREVQEAAGTITSSS